MDITAREHAKKQWNSTACGEMQGDKNTKDYFVNVESARYKEQSWMHDFFNFSNFKNKRILEIGLGQGTDLLQFAKNGADCHGIDITENHLMLTQRNLELHGYTPHLKTCDAAHIDYPDHYFDCVYSFGVLHHIPEIEKCIKEIERVLKPGGSFMFALYNKWSAFHLFYKLMFQGIYHGQLKQLGYQGLLSTIEHGADGIHIKPYVKLYSQNDVKKLISKFNFNLQEIGIFQLYATHFPEKMGKLLQPYMKSLENKLGWYVACKSVKKS